jgi:hypothetical protein
MPVPPSRPRLIAERQRRAHSLPSARAHSLARRRRRMTMSTKTQMQTQRPTRTRAADRRLQPAERKPPWARTGSCAKPTMPTTTHTPSAGAASGADWAICESVQMKMAAVAAAGTGAAIATGDTVDTGVASLVALPRRRWRDLR